MKHKRWLVPLIFLLAGVGVGLILANLPVLHAQDNAEMPMRYTAESHMTGTGVEVSITDHAKNRAYLYTTDLLGKGDEKDGHPTLHLRTEIDLNTTGLEKLGTEWGKSPF